MKMRQLILTSRTVLLLFVLIFSIPAISNAQTSKAYQAHLSKGVENLNRSDLDAALARFKDALSENPEGVEALYYLGVTHARSNRIKEAETYFLKALSLNRTFLAAHFDLAVLYYQIGEDEKAMAAFKIVERIDPERARVHYYEGLILKRKGREAEGKAKLEKAVALDPDLALETRYQEASAFLKSGELDSAREAFHAVIALSPDGTLAESAQGFIDQIDAVSKKRRWQINASLGIQYDDNVVLAPEGVSVDLGGVREKSDLVGVFGLRGKYRWKKGHWGGDAAYTFFQNLHMESSLEDFDIQDHRFSLSARRRIGRNTLGLKYTLQSASIGGDAFLLGHAVGPQLTLRHSARHQTEIHYTFGVKDFKSVAPLFPNNSDRDVDTHSAGFTHYTFLGKQRILYGGYLFEKEDAGSSPAEDDWSFNGHEIKVGVILPTWQSVRLSMEAKGEFRRFDNKHQLSPQKKREDDKFLFILALSRPFSEYINFSAQYFYQKNNSNISSFEYRRNITSIIMTVKY